MAQALDWKQVMEMGMQFTELRRSQARRIANELVAQGQLARDQLAAAVDDLVDMSRRRTEELRSVVRTEVQRQFGALGLATQDDLARLERKLSRAGTTGKQAAKKRAAKQAGKQQATGKKAAGKKAGKKAATRASTARAS